MAARKTDARRLDPERASVYWEKSQDFFRTMRAAAADGNWNGAALAGVHSAISAADALLVAKAGLRSSSKAHEDAADLLSLHVRDPQVKEQAQRSRRILEQKNFIEYVDKPVRQQDLIELQRQVERFTSRVQAQLSL